MKTLRTFKQIAEDYQEVLNEVKFKKVKKWKSDGKGNLKKVIVKQCQDSEGQKVPGFKVVQGKRCEKIGGAEKALMKKTQKKIQKTKKKHAIVNAKNAEKLSKKRDAKGL